MLDEGLGGEEGDPLDTEDLEKSSGWVWQSSRATLLLSSLLVHLHKKQSIRNLNNFYFIISKLCIKYLTQIILTKRKYFSVH